MLKGGETIVGKVVGEKDGDLLVEVEFGEIRIRRSSVAEIRPLEPERKDAKDWIAEPLPPSSPAPTSRPVPEAPPAPVPIVEPPPQEALPKTDPPPVAEPGKDASPPPPSQTPPVEEVGRAARPSPVTDAAEGGTLDERLSGALDRYLWFLPKQQGFLAVIGAGLLVVATFLTMLACRMADIEDRTFGRSLVFSASVLCLVGLSVEIQARYPAFLLPIVAVGLVLWFALTRGILRATLMRGGVLLVFFFFCTLLGVFWVEVVQIALRGD